jgi:hypothetical protein
MFGFILHTGLTPMVLPYRSRPAEFFCRHVGRHLTNRDYIPLILICSLAEHAD